MFCIQRQEAPDQWVQELCFKTEFKAYMCARTKSLATMNTYRVIDPVLNEVTTVVRKGKGLGSTFGTKKSLEA